jgi:protein ImuB
MLPERPLLTASREGSRRLVMAVDAAAAGLGLRPGMAVAHAQAMVPDLRIEEADPAGDAAALARLAAWCLRFSPLASPSPPDGVWIDITGCAHLFAPPDAPDDGEPALLHQLTARLRQAGIAARAAVADTPGAAHAIARHAGDPIVIAAAGQAKTCMAPLPIEALRLPAESVQALRTLGFDTIGLLMAAPRAPLAKRFGSAILLRLDQASGAAPEPIEPTTPPGTPRTRQGFPEPIATPEDLARAAALLTDRLCEKLAQRGLGASRLDLVFLRVDGDAQAIRIGTAAPTRDAAHMLRLLKPQIETIDPGFGIESVSLTASLAAPLGAQQRISDLCAAQAGADLAPLVDTLLNRLGAERIFRVTPVESDVPERSLAPIAPLARPNGDTWPSHLPRPARLFTPPRPIQAMALLPDNAPAHFIWRRRPYRVRHADGPERIFGEWWKDAAETWSVRDYFQVEDEAGQRFWLFRRGDGQHNATGDLSWFLHGIF